MFSLLHGHSRRELVGVGLVEANRQQASARLEPFADGRGGTGGEFLPAAGADDQHLIGRGLPTFIGTDRQCRPSPNGSAGRIAHVQGLPARGGFPLGHVKVMMFRANCSAAGSVSVRPVTSIWQKHHHPLAVAVLHQRAVLEAVAAVDDRQEIAAGGLLIKHAGHIPATAAPPQPRQLMSHHFKDVDGAVAFAIRNRGESSVASPRQSRRFCTSSPATPDDGSRA